MHCPLLFHFENIFHSLKIMPSDERALKMHPAFVNKFQYVERNYRLVAVSRNGARTILSQHNSFLAAEQALKEIPLAEGVVIRIEAGSRPLPFRGERPHSASNRRLESN